MKKFTAIICILAMLAALTGCGNNETSGSVPESNDVSTPESADNSESSPESPDIGTPAAPKQELGEEAQKLISGLKKQSFVGPDGETVQAADAVAAYTTAIGGRMFDDEDIDNVECEFVDTVLKYDFAYIGYVKPYCHFVIVKDGDLTESIGKWGEWSDELEVLQADREWLRVKVGDKLENGLTVSKAECEVLPTAKTDYFSMKLQLEGEFTMEGILTFRDKDDYLMVEGETVFNPDAVNTTGVPLIFNGSSDNRGYYTAEATKGGNVIVCDGQGMRLGLLDELDIDQGEIFGDNNYAHVKITFKDPEFYTDNSTDQMQAAFIKLDGEIVDIERID